MWAPRQQIEHATHGYRQPGGPVGDLVGDFVESLLQQEQIEQVRRDAGIPLTVLM
jgi:hypothetical protein